MNPILCLDIDGVLNNWTDGGDCVVDPDNNMPLKVWTPGPDIRPRIDALNAEALEFALRAVGNVDIILSSSWRKVLSLESAQAWLRRNGVPSARIVGRTCMASAGDCGTTAAHTRAGHIATTMLRIQREVGVRRWCAVDDDPSIVLHVIPHVHTDVTCGLTMTDAKRIIELLRPA